MIAPDPAKRQRKNGGAFPICWWPGAEDRDSIEGVTTMLENRRSALLAELLALRTTHERLDELMIRARRMPAFDAGERVDQHLVEGCVSALWLISNYEDGLCFFRCDSDSLVVKSIAGLLCEFYSGAAPVEILAMEPTFLRDAGITAHLTANRRNALSRVWGTIKSFAEQNAGDLESGSGWSGLPSRRSPKTR